MIFKTLKKTDVKESLNGSIWCKLPIDPHSWSNTVFLCFMLFTPTNRNKCIKNQTHRKLLDLLLPTSKTSCEILTIHPDIDHYNEHESIFFAPLNETQFWNITLILLTVMFTTKYNASKPEKGRERGKLIPLTQTKSKNLPKLMEQNGNKSIRGLQHPQTDL